jgi:hypothetical protein
LGYDDPAQDDRPNDRVLSPEEVAEVILNGLKQDRFLILPHPEAEVYFQRRAADMDRWVDGMRRLRRNAFADGLPDGLSALHRRI